MLFFPPLRWRRVVAVVHIVRTAGEVWPEKRRREGIENCTSPSPHFPATVPTTTTGSSPSPSPVGWTAKKWWEGGGRKVGR